MTETLALFAAAALFGGMLAFSFLFAPLVFAKLPEETAGRFIRAVFPWYYLFVLAAAALAALALAGAAPVPAAVMGAIALGGVVARQLLMPAINRARDRELSGERAAGRRFALLHRGSVVLNLAQMTGAAWVLWAVAA
jgi:hypothetical protein